MLRMMRRKRRFDLAMEVLMTLPREGVGAARLSDLAEDLGFDGQEDLRQTFKVLTAMGVTVLTKHTRWKPGETPPKRGELLSAMVAVESWEVGDSMAEAYYDDVYEGRPRAGRVVEGTRGL